MTQDAKYVLITGAAGGIGRALATEFANNGHKVIATDCVPMPDDLLCTHYLEANLAQTVNDEDYAEAVFAQIKIWLGSDGLHALINNAATQILGGVETLTREDWQTTLNVNLMAPFIWVQAFLGELEKDKGSVVNISSIHANLTKKNFVAYATSKAALSGMTRAMAVDLGGRVRVNGIEPAAIETKMLLAGFQNNKKALIELRKIHPTQDIGTPKQISQAVLFLTDKSQNFTNGTILKIDGGIGVKLLDIENT
jgi:NAD(P)-dependent dehydrogenase (short-subunit alcohol dehydrogenase family)